MKSQRQIKNVRGYASHLLPKYLIRIADVRLDQIENAISRRLNKLSQLKTMHMLPIAICSLTIS